jgi:transposase
MVTMSKRYPPEVREKALRLALDHLDEYPSAYAAAHAIGPMVDVHPETLRVWILKAKAGDAGAAGRPAPTPVASIEREELERLRRENRDLKQANEILKLASAFFARELDPRHH